MGAYFDHNATTPVDPRVRDAMLPYLGEAYGNPSSLHRRGRLARHAVEAAREQVAALVNAPPSEVIFTSGGTEANNQAINWVRVLGRSRRVAVSAVEHASVLGVAEQLGETGCEILKIPVDGNGRVSEEALEAALDRQPDLVSIMMANNETGVVQDILTFSGLIRVRGMVFHTDAVQAAGKLPLDFKALGPHMMSLSGHKINGPQGVGALIVDQSLEVRPLLAGGGQESGRRSGTENVAAIVGFGMAAQLARHELEARAGHMRALRSLLEGTLVESIPEAVVFGSEVQRLPNTVMLALPGIEGSTLVMALDQADFAISSGSACDAHKDQISHVLLAMGVAPELARCAIRVSLGADSAEQDVVEFVKVLKEHVEALQTVSSWAWA